ncbi:hypothetical protein PF005_g13621 [Phytophthora fragariae]|uniref:Uncharacterized protein n=2 Tax=Phytophthora TaxID=4783 RepID=A0A6A3TXM2_9STRA|nr:hypothetical protein PF003_g32621 [Phytophthora fragariae]KAE9039843.1 hypothetical protein PR002_g5259 [Phytophthora rubi]KAE8935110.1 hypothetical protein PF009_g14917 [Phytophthora fragariae]KAE9005331.1 hypothetical protein PF011_g12080 [Phytophthora fragariae]KAE9042737.1 hypothetical protein PR001_g6064 [Phytophthora rubi]
MIFAVALVSHVLANQWPHSAPQPRKCLFSRFPNRSKPCLSTDKATALLPCISSKHR